MSFMNCVKSGDEILALNNFTKEREMLTCLEVTNGNVWRFESDNVKQGTYILMDSLGKRYGAYNYTFYSNSKKAMDSYRVEKFINDNKGCIYKLDNYVVSGLWELLK